MARSSGVRRLVLWMNGERVGTWSVSQGKDQLQYEDSWLESPQARPLSLTLPFTPGNQPHRGGLVGAWFDNLLPDSPRLRERIAARFKTKGQGAFDLLAEVGRDSVGAIRLLNGSSHAEQDKANFIKAQFLFWLLCASDGHAKNFSIQLQAGGRYAMTPLYDVLSVYPVLGEGAHGVSPHKVRMAMALRGKSPHWKMQEIQPRHWHALARRHGVAPTGAGSPFEHIVDQTPAVIETIQGLLPADFPASVSESILTGLSLAAKRFVQAGSQGRNPTQGLDPC